MRVLIVKMSSMGDVIHTLPAITDAAGAIPGIEFDWVVEEAFQEVPSWHPSVRKVMPIALRRWRKERKGAKGLRQHAEEEMRDFEADLQGRHYDAVIDAQGLLKSAWVTRKVAGPRYGLSWKSARESLASLAYQHKINVSWEQHAVSRVRELFAQSLGYQVERGLPDYGLRRAAFARPEGMDGKTLVFLHGTTWTSKHYPEAYWRKLTETAVQSGYRVLLPRGGEVDKDRAERLAQGLDGARVLKRLRLRDLAGYLAHASGVVSVDTGLSHLAAALDTPQVCLYGATDPARTGAYGRGQFHMKADFDCAPCLKRECQFKGVSLQKPACYDSIPPDSVWQVLLEQLPSAGRSFDSKGTG